MAVGNECLGAVNDVTIAVAFRARSERLEIAAAARFGQADGGNEFTRRHLGQPAGFLRLGAMIHQERRNDMGVHVPGGGGHAVTSQLLDHDGVEQEVAAHAAICFRDTGAQQAEFSGPGPDLRRGAPGVLPFGVSGQNLLFQKPRHGFSEDFMLFPIKRSRNFKIHLRRRNLCHLNLLVLSPEPKGRSRKTPTTTHVVPSWTT